MEDIHCVLCRKEFNTKDRLPHLFPNCGHTFCTVCIQGMIDEHEDVLYCPEDNVECQFFNKTVGMGCFPLNFALHRLMTQKGGKKGLTTLDRLDAKNKDEEPVNGNYCTEHSKSCELVCLTDRKVICTDCVLFGAHKNHQYTRMDDFKKEVRSKVAALENKSESLKYMPFLSSKDRQVEVLRQKVDHKKRLLMEMVSMNVKTVIEEIRIKEREVESNLEVAFHKFDSSVNIIDNTAKKIKERHMDVDKTLFKIKAQIKRSEFDYAFLMNSLFSDNSMFATIKEISDELVQLEGTSADVIDRELDRYTIRGGVEDVTKMINSCMDVLYFDPSAEQAVMEHKLKQDFDDDMDLETRVVTPNKSRQSTMNAESKRGGSNSSTPKHYFGKQFHFPNNREKSLHSKSIIESSRSGVQLIREESISLLDPHVDGFGFDLLDDKLSRAESEYDQSMSRVNSTSLLSKKLDIRKNTSFFKKSSQPKHMDNLESSYYMSDMRENRSGYMYTQGANMNFLPEAYQSGEIRQSMYQRMPQQETVPQPKPRYTISQTRDKDISWNEQDFTLQNSRMAKSPVRRPTITSKYAPISHRQIAIESDTEANMSRMNINDNAVPQIITEIMKNKKLKALNLSHNSITEIGFEQIIKRLALHPTLERIYLMNNYLDDSVFGKIEQWAKKLKKINYFNFQNCSQLKNIPKIKKYVSSLATTGIKIDI